MKKEYLDFLYDLRSLIKADIDRLSESIKSPDEKGMLAELRTRRSQLASTDDCIKEYILIHNK